MYKHSSPNDLAHRVSVNHVCYISQVKHVQGQHDSCAEAVLEMQEALKFARFGAPDMLPGMEQCRQALSLALVAMSAELIAAQDWLRKYNLANPK